MSTVRMAAVRRSLRHRASKLPNTVNGVLSLVLLASCTGSTPTDSDPVIYRGLNYHTPGNGQGIGSRDLLKILDAHDIECGALEGSHRGNGAEGGAGSCWGTEQEWRQAEVVLAPLLASGHVKLTTDPLIEPTPAPASRQTATQ